MYPLHFSVSVHILQQLPQAFAATFLSKVPPLFMPLTGFKHLCSHRSVGASVVSSDPGATDEDTGSAEVVACDVGCADAGLATEVAGAAVNGLHCVVASATDALDDELSFGVAAISEMVPLVAMMSGVIIPRLDFSRHWFTPLTKV